MEAKDEITKDTLDYVFCKPGASGIYLVYQRTGKKSPGPRRSERQMGSYLV